MMTKLYLFIILLLAITAADVDANLEHKATESECVKFDEKRVEWLNDVAENGAVKSMETLTPTEYETITRAKCDVKFPEETINEFKAKMESLLDRQTQLLKKHKEIQIAANHKNGVERLLKQLDSKLMKKGKSGAVRNAASLVIYTKRLFMEIYSAEGEGARLDVFAFMELPAWKSLKIAFEISKIQSDRLDQLINEDIWQQNLANRYPQQNNYDEKNIKDNDTKNKKNNSLNDGKDTMDTIVMRRAVIEGAGTNGLLAAFKLFYAGMDVALVNDRLEYTRPQMVIYDSNWMCMFRYFLGTKFDTIFHSPGLVQAELGFIGIRFVEQAMKERLEELAKFVEEKKAGNAGNDDTAVGCLGGLKKMLPKRGKKKVTKQGENMVAKKVKRSVENNGENAVGGQLDLHFGFAVAGLEEASKEEDKNFYAKLTDVRDKLSKVDKKAGDELTKFLPVDLFLCMGGSGDKLREELLKSAPVPLTKTKNYTTGIYKKVGNGRKINLPEPLPSRIPLKMKDMQTQLTAAKFDELIGENIELLPENVRNDFQGFTKQLIDSDEANEFVMLENWEYFSLSAKTPKPLEALYNAIEQQTEKKGNNEKTKHLKEFDRRLRWKWAEAVFNFAYNAEVEKEGLHNTSNLSGPSRVNIDANGDQLPANEVAKRSGVSVDIASAHSFYGTVRMMENAALERKPSAKSSKGTNSVVVAALGDALANAHFYTGSGMSIGRKGVEFLVKSLNALLSGKIKSKHEFVAKLAEGLKNVAMDTVKLVKIMVPDVVL